MLIEETLYTFLWWSLFQTLSLELCLIRLYLLMVLLIIINCFYKIQIFRHILDIINYRCLKWWRLWSHHWECIKLSASWLKSIIEIICRAFIFEIWNTFHQWIIAIAILIGRGCGVISIFRSLRLIWGSFSYCKKYFKRLVKRW